MPYPFLSDEWVEEAHRIRAEFAGKLPPVEHPIRMNLVVNEVPFSDEPLLAHLDTGSGELDLDRGHLENPDLTITVDYATTKALVVDGDAQAALQAFMEGKVRVEGDMGKLMGLVQGGGAEPAQQAFAARLREITE
jgi:hypothetical protein